MKRIAAFILFVILAPTAAATDNFQDWWWNPALSGMGWNVGQQDNTITVAWYLYDSTENPTFLTTAGPLVGNTVEGTLFESFGPPPGPGYNPADIERIDVGTARIVFQTGNQATFTYDYDGLSGAINLQRFTYAPLVISGEWIALESGLITGCTDPSLNGSDFGNTNYSITQSGSSITIVETYFNGETCTYDLTGTQKGTYIDAAGTLSCDITIESGGDPITITIRGDVTFRDMRVIDDFLIFDYDLQYLTFETCRVQAKVSGITSEPF